MGRAGERRRLPPPGNSLKPHQDSSICPCSCHIVQTSLCALISARSFWEKKTKPTMVQTQTEGKAQPWSATPSLSLSQSPFFLNSKIVSSACSASNNSFPLQAPFLHSGICHLHFPELGKNGGRKKANPR